MRMARLVWLVWLVRLVRLVVVLLMLLAAPHDGRGRHAVRLLGRRVLCL